MPTVSVMTFIHFHHLSVDGDHGSIWRPWLTGRSRLWEVGEEGAGGSLRSRSSSEQWGEKIHKCCNSRLIFQIIRHIVRLNSGSRTQILPSLSPSSILLLLLLSFYSCLEIRNEVAVYALSLRSTRSKTGSLEMIINIDPGYGASVEPWKWGEDGDGGGGGGGRGSFTLSGCWWDQWTLEDQDVGCFTVRWGQTDDTTSAPHLSRRLSASPSLLSIHQHVLGFFYISPLLWECLWIKNVRMCGSEMKWALFYSCWRVLIRTQ